MTFPLKMPVGRQIKITISKMKGTMILYSVGTKAILFGRSSHSGNESLNGRNNMAQLNIDKVSANPTTKPPAMAP